MDSGVFYSLSPLLWLENSISGVQCILKMIRSLKAFDISWTITSLLLLLLYCASTPSFLCSFCRIRTSSIMSKSYLNFLCIVTKHSRYCYEKLSRLGYILINEYMSYKLSVCLSYEVPWACHQRSGSAIKIVVWLDISIFLIFV